MPSIYGYTRVSDDSQAKSGLSLSAQKKRIELAARHIKGAKLVSVLVDKAVSARRKPFTERKRGSELDRLLAAGDHLIVAKIDRAFRNLRDYAQMFERWKERGVYLHLLDLGVDTSTPVGELVAGIMAAVAQWESQRIGERIQEAKSVLRQQGRTTNRSKLFGFALRGKQLVPDPAELRTMALIVRLRKEGRTWRSVAGELNRRKLRNHRDRHGFYAARGRPWNHQAAWRAWLRECERRNPALITGRPTLTRRRAPQAERKGGAR
jgi:DNA invertase Pin-like site-specific DNA recombinase